MIVERFRLIAAACTLVLLTLACTFSQSPPPAETPPPSTPALVSAGGSPQPPTQAPTPSEITAPALTLPERSAALQALVAAVSGERIMASVQALAAIPTRHFASPGAAEAAAWIETAFRAAGGAWQVQVEEFPFTYNGISTTQRNVAAALAGSDPGAGIVLVGAHYDSRTVDVLDSTGRAPGANDNATGVAALIELAMLLGEEHPRATIVLVAFAAEEVGMGGSRHYAAQALARGDAIRAVIGVDTFGNAGGAAGEGALRAFAPPPDGGTPDTGGRRLARTVAALGEAYLPGFDVVVQPALDRPGRYGDHVAFHEVGADALRLIELVEDTGRNHSADDTPGRLSVVYLQQATGVLLAGVYGLAFGPPAPADVHLSAPGTVAWAPVPDAAAYLVALRRPEALEWETLVRVTGSASLTWDRLGDYAGISVASVDATGLSGAFSPEIAPVP